VKPATVKDAETILGNHFHNAEAVNKIFNCDLEINSPNIFNYTIDQLLYYQKIKPILFIGCDIDKNGNPITINWFMKRFPKQMRPSFWTTISLEKFQSEPSFNEYTCVRGKYYLIFPRIADEMNDNGKVINFHSSRKVFNPEQKILTIKEDEQIETAIIYTFATFLHYLATGEKLYSYEYILCQDKTSDGRRMRVGYFEYRQFYVGNNWPEISFYLGVAPGIKPII
jgi:hypothetical protein